MKKEDDRSTRQRWTTYLEALCIVFLAASPGPKSVIAFKV
jgi:hypothetical protein